MLKGECLVIAPIEEQRDSPTNKRTQQVYDHIILEACEGFYVPRLAPKTPKPGIITMEIIESLVTVPLVIADLTDSSRNVYYELAIRHTVGLPAILIVQEDQKAEAPYDIQKMNIISYDLSDLDKLKRCKENLKEQIKKVYDLVADYKDIVSDHITLMQIPEEPSDNKRFIGLILVASMVRFEIIEPYFERIFGNKKEQEEKRDKALKEAITKLLTISAHERFLRDIEIIDKFSITHQETLDRLYREAEEIVSEINLAIENNNRNKIAFWLHKWSKNNSEFFNICLKEYQDWLSRHLEETDKSIQQSLIDKTYQGRVDSESPNYSNSAPAITVFGNVGNISAGEVKGNLKAIQKIIQKKN